MTLKNELKELDPEFVGRIAAETDEKFTSLGEHSSDDEFHAATSGVLETYPGLLEIGFKIIEIARREGHSPEEQQRIVKGSMMTLMILIEAAETQAMPPM